jgi:hypothetical protein
MSKVKEKSDKVLSSSEVMSRLKHRHDGEGWGFLQEVRNSTGYSGVTRTADALAMSLWPSKGLHLHGFEVKVSRGDLMNDLKNPAKHQEIARHCHYWWLVVGDSKIIKDGELPEGWGLMVPRGEGLMVKVHAPLREVNSIPFPFLAAIFRKIHRAGSSDEYIAKIRHAAIEEGRKQGASHGRCQIEQLTEEKDRLKKVIAEFQEKSGIKLDRWNYGFVGETVNLLANNGFRQFGSQIKALEDHAEKVQKMCEEMRSVSSINEILKEAITEA